MVKFSNKAKAKPTKRMDLKKRYKIERKVKEHNKKLRKQAKKINKKGLKHRKNQFGEALPNLYPFKQQILQQFKDKQPKAESQSIIKQLNVQQYGLVTVENKSPYFPKVRGKNIKKYLTNTAKVIEAIDIALITVDPLVFELCRDLQLEKQLGSKILIYVIMKSDCIQVEVLQKKIEILQEKGINLVSFFNDQKHKHSNIQGIIKKITNLTQLLTPKVIGIFGKVNTGKNTLVKALKKYVGAYEDFSDQILQIILANNIHFIDSVIKINDTTSYPLFIVPQPNQLSKLGKEQQILRELTTPMNTSLYKCPILSKPDLLQYYEIQDYSSIDDMLKKIGKMKRIFGKGGMVDLTKVREQILSDWYSGRLNNLVQSL